MPWHALVEQHAREYPKATRSMRIWKLTPISTDDPLWLESSHRARVIVRAPDEESAREEAQRRLGVAGRFPPGTAFVGALWKRPNLGQAEIIDDSPHMTAGPLEVLEPSFETDLAARPQPKRRKR